jgi:hypothetical protein
MKETQAGRWEIAKRDVLARWNQILERINAHDDRGVLGLAAARDSFCDEATAARDAADARLEPPSSNELFAFPARGNAIGGHCYFCRGFLDAGGCLGVLDEMERAVCEKNWSDARRIAEGYIARVESLPFCAGDPP